MREVLFERKPAISDEEIQGYMNFELFLSMNEITQDQFVTSFFEEFPSEVYKQIEVFFQKATSIDSSYYIQASSN